MAISGSVQYARIRYKTILCPACGEKKDVPVGTRYKATVDGEEKFWCSYTCFREFDKARRRKDAEEFERQAKALAEQERAERRRVMKSNARATVKAAKLKISKYKDLVKASPAGSRQKKNAQSALASWKRKLQAAQDVLDCMD